MLIQQIAAKILRSLQKTATRVNLLLQILNKARDKCPKHAIILPQKYPHTPSSFITVNRSKAEDCSPLSFFPRKSAERYIHAHTHYLSPKFRQTLNSPRREIKSAPFESFEKTRAFDRELWVFAFGVCMYVCTHYYDSSCSFARAINKRASRGS